MAAREALRRSRFAAMAVGVAMLGLVAALTGGVWAIFTSSTTNTGNLFTAGTVIISDNDAGSAMMAMSGMKPGDTDSACITVTYTGSLPASVTLFGTTTGTGLDQYLTLTVTRGTVSSGSFDSCAGFTADVGGGVVYSGTVQGYPDSFAAGITDLSPTWSPNDSRAYRFTVTLQDDNGAQGLNATQQFTWEARS